MKELTPMRRTLLSIFLALLCTACKTEMSPIVDGTFSYNVDTIAIKRPLSQEQIQALTQWINRSSDGWGRCFMTPPGGPWSVTLHHADGTTSDFYLMQAPGQKGSSTLLAGHLSGTNLAEQPCAVQHFDVADIEALQEILGVPKT
jgi:hypothetical protein